MISSKFSTREFLEISNTRELFQSQKWAFWRQCSWVGDAFVEIFMSRVFVRSIVQKATHHRSELPRPFYEWATPITVAMISSKFSEPLVQKSHIIHRSELSGDHFHEWALISSKFACREFLEISNTREPQQLQNWAIWRPFYWVGVDFVQIFNSRVSCDL